MKKQHHYETLVAWTGNTGTGTTSYTGYERSHTISAAGKPPIEASADPSFRGDPARYNPEELFLASLASCHMLWYLHLCVDAGVQVQQYRDKARGLLETKPDGSGKFTRVILKPEVWVQDAAMCAQAVALHAEAHHYCFLAASVNFELLVEPVVSVGG